MFVLVQPSSPSEAATVADKDDPDGEMEQSRTVDAGALMETN